MNPVWLVLGFIGQAMFASRFLVQWIASERAHKSIIPVQFWILSIVGSAILTAYAIYRRDPVFILGQTSGLVVYYRNLVLLRRESRATAGNA